MQPAKWYLVEILPDLSNIYVSEGPDSNLEHAGNHYTYVCSYIYIYIYIYTHTHTYAGPGGHSVQGVGLRPLACWDCGFESHRRHRGLSIENVVCCQREVSAMGLSIIQWSPTDCGASLYRIQKPREWGSPGPLGAVAPKHTHTPHKHTHTPTHTNTTHTHTHHTHTHTHIYIYIYRVFHDFRA